MGMLEDVYLWVVVCEKLVELLFERVYEEPNLWYKCVNGSWV